MRMLQVDYDPVVRSPADKRNKSIGGAYLAEGVYPLSQGCGLVR